MAKNTKLALTINLVFFVLVLLLHLYRIFSGLYIQVGEWFVPIWLNIIAVVIMLVLIYINYKAL